MPFGAQRSESVSGIRARGSVRLTCCRHLPRQHHSGNGPQTLRADHPVPRHQHRNAPAPIQLLRRGALRSPAQRVRARTQGRVHHHESRGVGAEVREVLQRQGPLALRLAEAFFVVYQLGWVVLFATSGLVWCAISAAYVASCLVYLGFFYGDHAGKVCFAFDRSRLRFPTRARPSLGLAPPERS